MLRPAVAVRVLHTVGCNRCDRALLNQQVGGELRCAREAEAGHRKATVPAPRFQTIEIQVG